MSKRNLLLLLLLLFPFIGARSAGDELKLYFKSIGISQGLSHQLVNAIVKDSLGFIWVGTAEGLNRYDGGGFHVYRHEPGNPNSLSTSWINCLYITKDGSLFVGTEKGVNVYNPQNENFERISAENDSRNLLGNLRIRCFCEDSKGSLWIGTLDGLIRFDRRSSQINFYKLNHYDRDKMHNEVRSLCEDAEGRLWIGTFDGLYCRQTESGIFKPIPLKGSPEAGNCLISGLHIQPEDPHKLYIAATGGLRVLDTQTGQESHYNTANSAIASNDVRDVARYDATHVLAATSSGLSVFDIPSGSFTNFANSITDPVSLPTQIVRCLFRDDNGLIWLGTNYGIACCNSHRRPIDVHYINDTDAAGHTTRETITDIAVLPEEIWIGTNDGLRCYSPDMRLKHHYTTRNSPLPHNNIKRILTDRNGTMWIGTNNGVVYLDKERSVLRRVDTGDENFSFKYVYDIKEDNDGEIIVNISSGICFIRADRDASGEITRLHFRPMIIDNLVSSDNSDVPYFEPDKQGNLWIGSTSDGIFRYNKPGQTIVQYKNNPHDAASIASNRIYSIHTDALNRTWIGTDTGLCRYVAESDSFERIDIGPHLSIRTIASDDANRLWIATGSWLIMFDYELNYKITCDISQELKMNDIEYNSVCRAGGRIYLGGHGGFIAFDPQQIKVDVRRYPVRLTSFRLHNTPVRPGAEINGEVILDRSVTCSERIELRHDENFFRIDFALLNFAAGAGNSYSYKLDGYDKEWTTTDGEHGYASYSHIPPGRYTFRVNAANSDNIWCEAPAQIEIVVRPAWWRSTAAYIGYTLLFTAFCVLAVYLVRIRIRLARELKLEIMRRESYKEINQTKMVFFTNISHEFKTPLTLILGPIETLLETATESQRKMLLIMKQNAERLLRLINQIMDMRKIDSNKMKLSLGMGDIAAFGQEIYATFCDHARQRRIEYTFESHPFCINMLFDRDKIEKVFYNLLSNAFKFTPDGGRISLRVETAGQEGQYHVRITVSDTGCGIRSEELTRIFDRFYQTENIPHEQAEGSGIGLMLTKDYVKLHGGEIKVDSAPGSGSSFTVTLPYRSDFADTGEEIPGSQNTDSEQNPADAPGSGLHKIVIVEDNEQMLNFMKTTLGKSYEVYTAADGQQGLEQIRRVYPDLIISDLMMPRMDGFEMCKLVRQDALTSHIPFIMLTAKSNEGDRAASYNCGADAFISKPFSIKTLTTRIEGLIESRIKLQKLYRERILSSPSDIEIESENDKFILKLIKVIEENLENPDFNIQTLCESIDSSYQYVYRKVKALTGETINDFVRTIKLKRAAQYLSKGELRISEILYKSGFNSHSYFTKCFKEHYGMTPKEYVEQLHNTPGAGQNESKPQ